MHLTLPLRNRLPWLIPLKSVQLQRVARATGIQSSGTKGVLAERIQSTLIPYLQTQGTGNSPSPNGNTSGTSHPMSILSIDMGIQNLAFAHLRVSPDTKTKPELTAWRRLSMSEIGSLYLNSEAGGAEAVAVQSEDTLPPKPKAKTKTKTKEDGKAKIGKEKEPFCPSLYASNAYTLLNSLLSSYNPTHILIERQRFRSGGGSAVQEWTIRVGVLEGMLYAVLHTLRQERGSDVSQIQVHGIEPGRVVKYWIDREGGKMSAREVKKAKIGIVGELLERGKIGVPEGAVGDLVGMYLGKVNGKGNGKGKIEVGKLDDLADCLLQGVTWLEWEGMRGRLVKRGLEGLEC